ncbi:GGDEF domain-containing protein [Gordonia hydrophobica]|uniref:Diguanylate cyclase n=1 Tax=Gordonia hydrophobica TaxID=40516 RepID=A0ABZ2TWU6_9ACTN|nr:diguanylate cyclase [Gordonia hydrophobica]MBM7369324.1 GGDEF domain-containing protein [Gordonia hydrophobica]
MLPAVLVGFGVIVTAELLYVPTTSNGLFGLAAGGAILLVPLASSYELERISRSAWRRQQQFDALASTDALTGLPNLRTLRDEFARRLATSPASVSLALFDIDLFKQVNDTRGHQVGDEEFAVVWTETDADRALYRAKSAGRDQTSRSAPSAPDSLETVDLPVTVEPRPRTSTSVLSEPERRGLFRLEYEQSGLGAQRTIMGGLLMVCALLLTFQKDVLQIPDAADLTGRLFLLIGIMPPAAVILVTSLIPRCRRWSSEIYIACVAVIVTAQMVQRVMQLPKGYEVVPLLMPLAVILSMGIVRIRFPLLVTSMTAQITALTVTELVVLPTDSASVIALLTTIVMAAVTLRFAYRVEQIARLDWDRSEVLLRLSHVDALTGLANRRQFDDDLRALLASTNARRRAVVLIDVDHLKQFNDAFGHAAGDMCLRRVGRVISDTVQPRTGCNGPTPPCMKRQPPAAIV